MSGEDSPRRSVKAFVRGEAPAGPWLFPILFSIGSRLESLAPREFYSNPTKIASALRQIRATLKVDGLACYFDTVLEAEAVGCSVDWGPDGPSLVSGGKPRDLETVRRQVGQPESILGKGRIKIAAEVVRRLKVMLKDEPALMVRVTGPLTMARRIFGGQLSSRSTPSQDEVELAAQITAALSRHFVEAGADVVMLAEESLPPLVSETCEEWGTLLDPVINLIRFYEALPVLLLSDPNVTADTLRLICRRRWECVLCPALSVTDLLPPATWQSQAFPIGLALPTTMFASVPDNFDVLGPSVRDRIKNLNPILLTTSEDVAASADLKHVGAVLRSLREALWPMG